MGVAPSCTCNGMILVERRRIIDAVKEREWELVPHNWAQNDLLTYYAHKPDEERAVIRRTLDTYREVVGKPAKAWLSSAIRGTAHTPAFLKEFGIVAYCDYLNDDQPYLIDTIHGPVVCVPWNSPLPNSPPEPMAIRACVTLYPAPCGSAVGSANAVNRLIW